MVIVGCDVFSHIVPNESMRLVMETFRHLPSKGMVSHFVKAGQSNDAHTNFFCLFTSSTFPGAISYGFDNWLHIASCSCRNLLYLVLNDYIVASYSAQGPPVVEVYLTKSWAARWGMMSRKFSLKILRKQKVDLPDDTFSVQIVQSFMCPWKYTVLMMP
ncbi:hypothetical protein CEXT_177491 [Caerostris extrusa]|uniref:Uncharacterized protein n=1 Tax=Caerostris extrusa TaxID=172846 RepID=A0AAV4XSR8_CAEEX|nr:hypothetical protein CEXT_177491 [Caerostris extrusa]